MPAGRLQFTAAHLVILAGVVVGVVVVVLVVAIVVEFKKTVHLS